MRHLARMLPVDLAWVGFFLLAVLAWAGLLVLGAEHRGGPALGAVTPGFDVEFWRALCLATPLDESYGRLVGMWGLMAGAMMAPTAVPMLAAYRDLTADRPRAEGALAAFLAGYLAVWLVFAAGAAGLQAGLAGLALLSPHAVSLSDPLTAGLLLVAGFYQFSALKAACLSRCRAPFAFLMSNWRAGPSGAWRMGARHGAVCVGCCWALMLLAFVGGAMNLVWMGGAMALMVLEKLPALGRPLTAPLGLALIAAGAWVAARAAGL